MPPQTQVSRRLTATPTGDFWRGKVVPLIRLQGQWLKKAGIQPGDQVLVQVAKPGQLILTRCIHGRTAARKQAEAGVS